MKFGLLWGCGLGDWIVAFPAIKYLTESLGHQVFYFTKTSHVPKIFLDYQARNSNFKIVFVPKGWAGLPLVASYWGRLDCVVTLAELGKHANYLLGYALLPRQTRFRRLDQRWIGEQIFELFAPQFTADGPAFDAFALSFAAPQSACIPVPTDEYALLHPFARLDWQTKQWPMDRWVALIEWLVVDRHLRVLIAGDFVDRELADRLVEQLPTVIRSRVEVLLGRELGEIVELSKRARIAVCHNSGLMHIFAQLGTETVVINGASAPAWLRPEPWVHNIDSGLCQLHCNSRQCILPQRDARCVTGLPLERVRSLVDDVLQKTGASRGGQVPLMPES